MPEHPPPPPKGSGRSLYANLLDPKAAAAAPISRAPVAFKQATDDTETRDKAAAKPALDAALRFQPIRRPQAKQKPKASFPKVPAAPVPSAPGLGSAAPPPPSKSTLADWAATEDDEYLYGTGEKRQRGGRKRKKKNNRDGFPPAETDWDELYDPARPTNVDEYLRSDERIREVQEWKAVLYRHRSRKESYDSDEDAEDAERPAMGNQFAPPTEYSFAPPPPPSPPTGVAHGDASGEDAFARRLALSQSAAVPPASQPPPPPPPPPPPADNAPPPPTTDDGTTISRAPIRYAPAEPEIMDIDDEDDEAAAPPMLGGGRSPSPPADGDGDGDGDGPRSNRPGQAGFAQRLMSKYGWTKGSGLGADESGITDALRVRVEKRRRKADADGGGWAEPAARATIIGGAAPASASGGGGRFGPMSDVVVLRNMLEGMEDLRGEIESGLGQEIGEECGEKYGRVERLYIDIENRQVFIKFTDQVSALRAVNALEGRIFNGNAIAPTFYDTEKFEMGIYTELVARVCP